MIKIPKLADEELKKITGKQVIVRMKVKSFLQIIKIFKYYGIKIIGFYPKNKCTITEKIIIRLFARNVQMVDEETILSYAQKYTPLMFIWEDADDIVVENLKAYKEFLEVEFCNIKSGQIITSFQTKAFEASLLNRIEFRLKYIRWCLNRFGSEKSPEWKQILKNKPNKTVVICSPTKTGDVALVYTLNKLNHNMNSYAQPINYINLWHRPQLINHKVRSSKFDNVKIIMGIRDPIAQNLSAVFQCIADGMNLNDKYFLRVKSDDMKNKSASLLVGYQQLLCEISDDIQEVWDLFSDTYLLYKKRGERHHLDYVQFFVSEFQKHVVDILEYPFDKEKGYSIVRLGNTEVFVYQLEKLNSIVPEFSDWIGIPFEQFERGNYGEDKWTVESYKQAQQEIKISQEYFDSCYNEPYVQHCYSKSDIDKMKARWRSHIKE